MTRPARMNCSLPRREAMPASARNFWRRISIGGEGVVLLNEKNASAYVTNTCGLLCNFIRKIAANFADNLRLAFGFCAYKRKNSSITRKKLKHPVWFYGGRRRGRLPSIGRGV